MGVSNQANIKKDLDLIISKFKKLEKDFKDTETKKRILSKGGRIFRDEARRLAPKYDKGVHKRYRRGRVVAEYHPGNLRRSIRLLDFDTSTGVFVGPQYGEDPDGFYARWVEFQTDPRKKSGAQPFMRPAFENRKSVVTNKLAKEYRKLVRQFEMKYGVKGIV